MAQFWHSAVDGRDIEAERPVPVARPNQAFKWVIPTDPRIQYLGWAKIWATMIEREMDAGVLVSRNEVEATSFELYAKEMTSKKRSSASELSRSKL